MWYLPYKAFEKELPQYFFRHRNLTAVFFGKLFNYPKCCIKQFDQRGGLFSYSPANKRRYENSILDGSGYVPCDKCLRKNHRVLLDKINKQRSIKHKKLLPGYKHKHVHPFSRLINLKDSGKHSPPFFKKDFEERNLF